MRTAGQFQQDTPFTDGQIFLGPGDFSYQGGAQGVAYAIPGNGLYYLNLNGVGNAYYYVANLNDKILLRTGTAPLNQSQFGTAASVPGPSSIANTSDPLNLSGMPPIKKANLPALTGGYNGYVSKGFQVNWIDVVYSTGANALANAQIGLTATKFANNVAPVVTNLIAYGNNSLPLAAQTNPYVTRVNVANPSFIVTTDTAVQLFIELLTGATGSTQFYGAFVGVSFNFN